LNLKLYGWLIDNARRRHVVTYEDCYRPGRTSRRYIGQQLDAINRHENAEGRPLLSVICVSKATSQPGAGFWESARQSPAFKPNADQRSFVASETARVFETWAP